MKKIFIFLSIISFSIILLTSCQSIQGLMELYGPNHEHSWSEWRTLSEPTCFKVGSQLRTCPCGETQTQELELKMHKTGGWIFDQDPTCIEAGAKHQYCIVCNTVLETEPLSATGHTAGEWVIEKDSTCTESGSKYLSCTKCGQAIEKQTIPAEHKTGIWVTDKESTCTEKGSEHFECTICNTILKSQELDYAKHIEGKWITDKEASCTANGEMHQVCSVCNTTIKTESISALGHKEGKWITDKNATCTKDGSKHQICERCNKTINTETIKRYGDHAYEISYLANGGKIGSEITYKCTRCTDSYTDTVKELSVSVKLSGTSSSTMNGYGTFSKTYTVTVSGGYGKYRYKYEVYDSYDAKAPMSHLTKDFSDENKYGISYRGYENAISGYILKVTVVDEAGNQAEYSFAF